MGDRISFQFRKEADYLGKKPKVKTYEFSITFFSHWDGRSLLGIVDEYSRDLQIFLAQRKKASNINEPLDRLEPRIVMIDFICWMAKHSNERFTGNYYLGKDAGDGDNGDNGHWIFDLDEMKWVY